MSAGDTGRGWMRGLTFDNVGFRSSAFQCWDDRMWGGRGNDRVYGHDGRDLIFGEAGNDTLRGYDGDDLLSGGRERDNMSGGSGNDTTCDEEQGIGVCRFEN